MLSDDKKPLYSLWEQYHGKIFSHTGGWFIEKGAFSHHYNIMQELAGNISYLQMVVLNTTGKLPDKAFTDWLEAVFIGMSWPDSRLWCNQVGALAASLRAKKAPAILAGILASDSKIYGSQISLDGVEFIKKMYINYEKKTVKELIEELPKSKGKPIAIGYSRPIAIGDERVPVLIKIAADLGFEIGPHVALAFELERYMEAHYQEKINITGYGSAFLADQGYTGEDASAFSTTIVFGGVIACYLDYLKEPAETFLPLKCDDIIYKGKAKREVPC